MTRQNKSVQSDERNGKNSEKKGMWVNSNPFDLTSELVFVEDETQ